MDHDYIENFDIVDRYAMSRLAEKEKAEFEEHYIDCPQCIARLQTARDFALGMRLLTVQQIRQQESSAAKESPWVFSQRFSRRTWALATCGLLLGVLLISILALIQIRHLRQEAERTENAILDLRRLQEEDQQSAFAFAQERQEIEQGLREHIQQLEADLQTARQGHTEQTGTARGWIQPNVNLPIIVLNSVRNSEVTEIKLSHTPMDFVISLPLEGEAKYPTYRVTVFKDQQSVWESSDVKPDPDNALIIGFNSRFFQPGKYRLQVEGAATAPGSGEMTDYPFRILKRP
jgi:hypothetical protein